MPRADEPSSVPSDGLDLGDVDQLRDPEVRVAGLIGRDRRVLVVGRRTRGLCRLLASDGCRVSAAADPRAIAIGRKLPAGPFDAVALIRVVEYVDDPVGLLRRLARLLTNDGSIVAAVPNITHGSVRLRLLAGLPPAASFEADAPSAWRCYDGKSVRQLFERAGFMVTEIERCREAFDCSPEAFTGPAIPAALIQDLAADIDALTSAFVVVAHKSPLTGHVQLQLRVRELAARSDADRQALDALSLRFDEQDARSARLESLERRHDDLSGELSEIRRNDSARVEREQRHLRSASAAVTALGQEAARLERDLTRLQYDQVVGRIRGLVERLLPRDAVVLVASKGDPRLVDLAPRTGWHFLQTADGVYAGHHPADSDAAIRALKQLRAKGAGYLLFPKTSLWWLDHYAAFREFLDRQYRVLVRDARACVIYALSQVAPDR